jgi:hypothetical protein
MISEPVRSGPWRRVDIVLTLVLTLLGLTLRFYRISDQSLWTDEIASIETARVPLSQITQVSGRRNNCLPTYFLVLRALVGDSNRDIEFRARSLSAVLGGLSVALLTAVVFYWRRNRAAALLAGLLLAINPLHLWYSQEVRAYATMLFFGLLTLLTYELARRSRNPWWWVLYLVCALAAIALHKTAVIFPVACALWHGSELRGMGRARDIAVHVATLGLAGAVLLFSKSYPPLPEYGRPSSILEFGYTFMTFMGGYSFGPSLTDIQSHGAWVAISHNLLQVGIAGGVLSLLALAYVLEFRLLIWGKETTLLFLGIGVVALAALASSFPYNVRYALPALLGFVALVAALSDGAGRRHIASLTLAAMLVVASWADAQWFYSPRYRKADSRAVAQWLVANEARVNSWTVLPEYLSGSVEWYLQAYPEIVARKQSPRQPQTTTFPPVPDVLIIGRRHHVQHPDEVIAAYRASAGEVRTILSIVGFELYARNWVSGVVPGGGTEVSLAPSAPR